MKERIANMNHGKFNIKAWGESERGKHFLRGGEIYENWLRPNSLASCPLHDFFPRVLTILNDIFTTWKSQTFEGETYCDILRDTTFHSLGVQTARFFEIIIGRAQ